MSTDGADARTLTLFGATGRTGRLILRHALQDGWTVRALARTPSRLGVEHPRLEVVAGDVLDPAAVAEAVRGADAVVSVIGRTKDTDGPLMGPAARNITAAMREAGVRRLVAATGAGVRAPGDEPKVIDKAIVGLMKVIARDALTDGDEYARAIRDSGLEWTLVRAPRLNDGPPASDLYVGPLSSESGTKLSREDFARYALAQVDSTQHLREMPVVSAA